VSLSRLILAAVLGALLVPAVATANAADPAATTANASVLGATHAAWWQWSFSFRLSEHPLNPGSGAGCDVGQPDGIRYLGGVFNASGTVTRDCTVPADAKLVAAVANVECSTLEPFPFAGTTDAQLRACAAGVVHKDSPLNVTDQFATLDGKTLGVQRAASRPFEFTVPDAADNILACAPGCAATEGRAVADGYLLVLEPGRLALGRHTLRFGGTFPAFGFTQDITYVLDVVPAGA
jgi:hypothetical protein